MVPGQPWISAILDPMDTLEERLRETGAIDDTRLARARKVAGETGARLDAVICRLGFLDERTVAEALAGLLSLDFLDPADLHPSPELVTELGPRFLSNARVLPLEGAGDAVPLAMADPLERSLADAVALKLGRPVTRCVATAAVIEAVLERFDTAATDQPEAENPGDTADDVARLRELASDAPVVRIVNLILRKAVEAGASDIHLEPGERGLAVRLRIDGILRAIDAPPADLRAAIVSRLKIMAGLNIAEQRLPQDGRIRAAVAGREIDLRVTTAPVMHGEAVVLRVLDRSGTVLDFDGLGLDAPAQAALDALIARPNGIVLVTGPTGSGKTTTLYAALARINDAARKIVTVEDPVEYQIDGISQIQVRGQIGLTFAAGLRSILRQDPDIIMVGEIRDLETAQIAVQAALTGHLVLATLHTNSAAAAVNRLRDMGIPDYLLAATMAGVVAQRLVRRLCPDCAEPGDPALAPRLAPDLPPERFAQPGGCAACGDTGYRGRLGVLEILTVDDPIRAAILAGAPEAEVQRLAGAGGMRTMLAYGIEQAAARKTALAEIARLVAGG